MGVISSVFDGFTLVLVYDFVNVINPYKSFKPTQHDISVRLNNVILDIDECALNPCGDNAQCINTPGTYRCQCIQGYIGRPPTTPCKGTCSQIFRIIIRVPFLIII